MPTSPRARRSYQSLIACGASMAAILLFAGPAHAGAVVSTFTDTETNTYTAPLEGCLPPDLVGTVTLTVTVSLQEVDNPSGGVAVHGTNTFDYRLDLPEGMYVLTSGKSNEHFAFVVNPPMQIFNGVQQDVRTIYAANGTAVGTLTIREESHLNWTDRDGDHAMDPDEITVLVDRFRLRCG
jgi:hypothetical protein